MQNAKCRGAKMRQISGKLKVASGKFWGAEMRRRRIKGLKDEKR